MKRMIIIVFVLAIILIVGCSNQKELTEEQLANMSDEDIYAYTEDRQAIAGEAVKTKKTSLITCSDTDFGKIFAVKGTTTATIKIGGNILRLPDETDKCVYNNPNPKYSNLLVEFFCEPNKKRSSVSQTCEQNCIDGACVKCYDNDDNNNKYVKGIVRNGVTNTGELLGNIVDNCYYDIPIGKNVLAQYDCEVDGTVERIIENCPNTAPYCGDGICTSTPP